MSRREEVERLKQRAYEAFGDVALLMNNAGRGGDGGLLSPVDGWKAMIDTNLWGVIHGVQVFAPAMIAAGAPGAIVNTGSKQGITCPPGNTAYNVVESRREGGDGGAGARAARDRGLPDHRASPHPGLHPHRHHQRGGRRRSPPARGARAR